MYNDITGIILAGGKSTRMGREKALLEVRGKKIIEIIVDLINPLFEHKMISTNSPSEFSYLGLPIVEDEFRYAGPLAGIHAALKSSGTEKNFIISCDVPLMSRQMIEFIITADSKKPIVITRAVGFLQPLIGVYSKSLVPVIEQILSDTSLKNSSHKSLHKLIDIAGAEILSPITLPFYKDELFFNMNNKDDYEKIIVIFEQNI